jgi:hypothetical protein
MEEVACQQKLTSSTWHLFLNLVGGLVSVTQALFGDCARVAGEGGGRITQGCGFGRFRVTSGRGTCVSQVSVPK